MGLGKMSVPYGLTHIPDVKDGNLDIVSKKLVISIEFSKKNQDLISKELLSIKDKCSVILEIGVHRSKSLKKENGSTYCLIANKLENSHYIGVDAEDRKYVESWGKNVKTLKISSSETKQIMDFVKSLGHDKIDFLHIDGDHSFNQVLKDWKFSEFLSENGTIAIHDTSYHLGPIKLIEAIDREKFEVAEHFHNRDDDWGITIIKRKKDV